MPGTTTRATVYQTIRYAKESSPGFGGATLFRLRNMELTITPDIPIKPVKYPGSKAATDTQVEKEMASLKFTGPVDFNTLGLLCDTMFSGATPTQLGAAAPYGQARYYNPSPVEPTPHPDTLVIELGSSRGAERMTYCVCSGFVLKWSKDELHVEGTMFGAQGPLDRNIAVSPGVVTIKPQAAYPRNCAAFVSDDGTNYVKLQKNSSGQISLEGLWTPNFHINDDTPSFDSITESMPNFSAQVTVDEGADVNSEASKFMTRLRNGQLVYLGFRVKGNIISVGTGVDDPTSPPLYAAFGTGGTLPVGTVYVSYTFKNAAGETNPSPGVAVVLGTATSSIVVNARQLPPNATGINAYVSSDGVTYLLAGTSATERVVVTAPPQAGMQFYKITAAGIIGILGIITGSSVAIPWLNATGTPNIVNMIRMNFPMLVTKPEPGDKGGVYGNTFSMEIADDSTFGLAQILLVNAVVSYSVPPSGGGQVGGSSGSLGSGGSGGISWTQSSTSG